VGRVPEVRHTLAPGTGRAVELRRGDVLRIAQTAGGQCADFNAFALDDYKEHFHAGRTRAIHGISPSTGASLWSAPPRDRPMLTVIADSASSNDLLYPRCTAALFEFAWGVEPHTNCQDILAEAMAEYGLTPDDVHDSFNLWMNTGVDDEGRLWIDRNTAQADDSVELLAQMDVLAVVSVCGADLFNTSNFSLKPLTLEVRVATEAELERWATPEERWLISQRTPEDFRISEIKATRELSRAEGFEPRWPVYPVESIPVNVELDGDAAAALERLRRSGEAGTDDAEALRFAFFTWCAETQANYDAMRRYDD
jgi:uncharacterized protein YcgI (DUF1989 family)